MNGSNLKQLIDTQRLISKAMNDKRFPAPRIRACGLRMFVVTALWVQGVERVPVKQRAARISEIMGLDMERLWGLIRDDLPRYEPDSLYESDGCPAMLPRAKRRCGQRSTFGFRVTNPADGTWEMVGYCGRHREEGEAVQDAERRRRAAGAFPEPLPNRGGLLPCYLQWNWPVNYAKAAYSDWTPPKVGICADDWPVLAKVKTANLAPVQLQVIAGEADSDELPIDEADDAPPPELRLIRDTRTVSS